MGAPLAARLPLGERELQIALLGVAVLFGLVAGGHPTIAVAGAIGLAFMAAVMANLTFGLCVFAIVVFMDLLPEVGVVVSFSKAVGLLLAVSWLATITNRENSGRGFISAHPYILYVLVVFLGWAAASTAWAEDASLTPTPFFRYALNVLLFVIVFAAIRERRHVVWLLGAYVAGAALSAIYGFVAGPPSADVGDRVAGSIGDPNELASVLLPAFVIGLALAAALKRAPIARLLALSAAGVAIIGLFLTLSRGGLVALAVAMVAALFVAGRWRLLVAALVVLIGLSGVGYFTFFASDEARERVTTLSGGTGREDIWTVGWRMFRENPIAGVGAGNFEQSSVHYLLEPGEIQRSEFIVDQPKVAHNTYLHVLAELGIVGLLLFVAIAGFALWCAMRAARTFARKEDLRMELLARATLIGVIGLLAACFFISEMYSKQLWLLMGFCPPLLAVARRQPPAVEDPVRIRSGIASRWSAAPSPTAPESEIASPDRPAV